MTFYFPQWKLDFFEAMDNHGRGPDWIYRPAPKLPAIEHFDGEWFGLHRSSEGK